MHSSSDFMLLLLRANDKLIETQRVVYNIFDALSDTGGFASVITLIFTMLTLRIYKMLFYQDITSKFFLFYEPLNP